MLLLAGDDHTCKSSTLPHQSEYAFMDACIPVLNPAGVQELLDLGLYGWAMSRYSGCWIAFKTIAETVDSSASVEVGPERFEIVQPDDFEMPPGGLNIRWPDQPLDQEYRLHRYKLYAALAFARANRLDRIVIDSPRPRFGIVTTGKSYLDVRQALDDLGIDDAHAADIGYTPLQSGDVLAARTRGDPALCRGTRRDPRRGRKARNHREPIQRSNFTIGARTSAQGLSASLMSIGDGFCRRTAS